MIANETSITDAATLRQKTPEGIPKLCAFREFIWEILKRPGRRFGKIFLILTNEVTNHLGNISGAS
jgi:hypothetical protein